MPDISIELIDLFERFLPPAIGSLIGVYAGFRLDRWHLEQVNQERTNSYLKGLTNEISEAIALLEKKKLQLLPNDLWQSAVHSGDLALFPYEVREDLRQAYFAIVKCNYVFKRTISIGDRYRADADTPERAQRLHKNWAAETQQALYMTESTLEYLRRLSKKEWFIKASSYTPD